MMEKSQHNRPRLILVYNADGGIINALMHAVHKQVAPDTYPCSLCAITYGAVSMRGEWRRYLDSLPLDVVIHHKDDFEEAYPGHGIALPAILIGHKDDTPKDLVPAKDLDAIKDTDELMNTVEERLIVEQARSPEMRIIA
ncbi:MAG: hypothetical protein ABJN35_07305 [Erythrobacter sp.]